MGQGPKRERGRERGHEEHQRRARRQENHQTLDAIRKVVQEMDSILNMRLEHARRTYHLQPRGDRIFSFSSCTNHTQALAFAS